MIVDDFNIKIASIDQLDEFVNLESEVFTGDIIKKTEFKRLFDRKNVNIYGVWFKQKLIASAILIFKPKKNLCRLYGFGVSSDFRNMGIAQAMLYAVEKECATTGYLFLTLECSVNNKSALNFYEKMSYRIFGEYKSYYEDGSDAYRLQKSIEPYKDFKKKRWVH